MHKFAFKVLVVDDEPEFCEMLVSTLQRELNAQILVSDNGRDAIIQFGLHRPNVIISDIRMPKGDGFEFLERIRQLAFEQQPTIVLTTGYADKTVEELLADGADALFQKPFELISLIATIKRLARPIHERWKIKTAVNTNPKFINYTGKNKLPSAYLGRRGFFIPVTDGNLPDGSLVQFNVHTEFDVPLEGMGRVIWQRKSAQDGRPAGYGIEFLELEPATIDGLIQFNTHHCPISAIPRG